MGSKAPIAFVGHPDINARGKYLLEILGQLKNFGVGRIVTKGAWRQKWPNQPSYIMVKKVFPEMDRWLWRGSVIGDWIYRGKNLGVFQFSQNLDRSDWHLVHKHEEQTFRHCEKPFEYRRLPSQVPLPPLLRIQKMVSGKGIARGDQLAEKCEALMKEGHSLPMMECKTQFVDEEFQMLVPHSRNDAALNPASDGTIYDVDKSIYLDLYGDILPLRVDKWDSVITEHWKWKPPPEDLM